MLQGLGWAVVAETPPPAPDFSLYTGFVTGVEWQTNTTPPGGAPADASAVKIAVGNSSAEALTALVATEARQAGVEVEADLLAALQLDLLRLLDQPDGQALLANQIQASGFQRFPGGYAWELADAPNGSGSPGHTTAWSPSSSPAERDHENQVLAALNEAQSAYDEAVRELADLQERLYFTWWNSQQKPPTDSTDELDPTQAGTVAASVAAAMAKVATLQRAIPGGTTADEVAASIAAYAAAQGLPAGRTLKRLGRPRFVQPNNPVVLLAGAGASGIPATGQVPLVCRNESEIVSGLRYGGAVFYAAGSQPPAGRLQDAPVTLPPLFDLSNVAGVPWSTELIASLLTELFFLDPTNAPAIAAAAPAALGITAGDIATAMTEPEDAVGTPPSTLSTVSWGGANPWHPLLLLWQASYTALVGTPPPSLQIDPAEFTSNPADPATLGGLIVLTPAAAVNVQQRLQSFLASTTAAQQIGSPSWQELQELLRFVGSPANPPEEGTWDLLSQALDGFNEQLLGMQTGLFPAPTDPPYAGYPAQAPPFTSLLGTVGGYPPNAAMPFNSWRNGSLQLTALWLLDEWGQLIKPIDNDYEGSQSFFATPPEMTPADPKFGLVQIPPGLLQPARLTFDLVSAEDDAEPVWLHPGADPICGWVVSNFLDHSLLVYDADGQVLGELGLGVGSAPVLCWRAAPGAPAVRNRHLRRFLRGLYDTGVETFPTVMAAVDTAVSSIVPQGNAFDQNLALLAGRPLALVRASVRLELDGPPVCDPNAPVSPSSPSQVDQVTTYPFAVELGNLQQITDGLVGYYTGDDYSVLNVVQGAAAEAGPYLAPIGGAGNNFLTLSFAGDSGVWVTMLMDPRSAVHATTAILPVQTVQVSPQLVAAALARMSLLFRVDTILTDASTSGAPTMPLPTKTGAWSWLEQGSDGTWTSYAVAQANANARLSSVRPVLRRGLLALAPGNGEEGG